MALSPVNPNLGQTVQSSSPSTPALDLGFIAHLSKTPAAVSATGVHAAIALTAAPQVGYVTGFPVTVTVTRNITIKGNAVGNAGNVTVYGTNRNGDAISETLALNGSTEVVGNKAFKTVTKVDLPAETHSGTDTVSVGFGSKLGLHHKLAHNTVTIACLNNAREATAPTVAVSTSALESNTVQLNSALDGNVVDIYYTV